MPQTVNSFSSLADTLRVAVDRQLAAYCQFPSDCPATLGAAIRHSLLAPGKRLRPLLVLWSAEACGSTVATAMPAACAVEMVHTYSLIHDDLPAMDNDDLRRGRPTCHRLFGEGVAILAGDALLAQAFEILAGEVTPAALAASCCRELAQAAGATALVGGQADDLAAENQVDLTLGDLESIHRRKTGALLAASLRLGALIAQATREQFVALDTYGRCLGLAFQITDDLLDHDGDPQLVGKQTQKDQGRGKLTFPALLGADASRRRAEQLIEQACQALGQFGSRAQPLKALADYILERDH